MRIEIFKNNKESICKDSLIVKDLKKKVIVNTQYLSLRKCFIFNVYFFLLHFFFFSSHYKVDCNLPVCR